MNISRQALSAFICLSLLQLAVLPTAACVQPETPQIKARSASSTAADVQAISDFGAWAQNYANRKTARGATATSSVETDPEGLRLANLRRDAMWRLICFEPEKALELELPAGVRAALPEQIEKLLETRLEGDGEIIMTGQPAPGAPGATPRNRLVLRLNQRAYTIYSTRHNFETGKGHFTGIAVEGSIALNSSSLHAPDASPDSH